ncbi:pigment-dispersing factor [Megachile rotundata]|uniref:pigment-dispersing factor n=1 Tax=Megachile rotundata TaxID=143995 RepID=UPI000258D8F0|nr:PREDICTED: protein PDF-like [Megachile rotundata]
MASKYVVILIMVLAISSGVWGVPEEANRNLLDLSRPCIRGLNNDLQLARLLLLPQWLCHPKRNSELINALLGLPKNVNISGK